MDLRTRLIAPSFNLLKDGMIGDFDLDALVKRLLLFETYIIDSQGLTEIPHLIQAFTLDGLFMLLEAGVLKLNCSFSDTGSLSSSESVGETSSKAMPSPFRYKFVTVEPAEINEYVNLLLQDIEPGLKLTSRQTIRLRRAIYSSLERPDSNIDSLALKATREEMTLSTQILKSATVITLYKYLGIRAKLEDIEIFIQFDSDNNFKAESNIQNYFGLDQPTTHQVIERSCLAIARRNDRVEQMRRFSALTGFSDLDLPIFSEKLDFLVSTLSPDVQEHRFHRVLELTGLPQIKDVAKTRIDVRQLLKIKDSVECAQFRQWLATTDAMSDEEINQQIHSFSKIVGRIIGGEAGQNIRFLITNAIGFVPVVGPVISVPLSILDKFLIDKVFPRSGITAFVDEMYPSLFKN